MYDVKERGHSFTDDKNLSFSTDLKVSKIPFLLPK